MIDLKIKFKERKTPEIFESFNKMFIDGYDIYFENRETYKGKKTRFVLIKAHCGTVVMLDEFAEFSDNLQDFEILNKSKHKYLFFTIVDEYTVILHVFATYEILFKFNIPLNENIIRISQFCNKLNNNNLFCTLETYSKKIAISLIDTNLKETKEFFELAPSVNLEMFSASFSMFNYATCSCKSSFFAFPERGKVNCVSFMILKSENEESNRFISSILNSSFR